MLKAVLALLQLWRHRRSLLHYTHQSQACRDASAREHFEQREQSRNHVLELLAHGAAGRHSGGHRAVWDRKTPAMLAVSRCSTARASISQTGAAPSLPGFSMRHSTDRDRHRRRLLRHRRLYRTAHRRRHPDPSLLGALSGTRAPGSIEPVGRSRYAPLPASARSSPFTFVKRASRPMPTFT